jgi:hypothetical protein
MTADVARITYDPSRQYRSVITQQGRVTLEADANEGATIASEALRLETIDVVGPTGTPDDGYKVGSGNGPGGVSIGKGVFYLGGWRLELDQPIDLSQQPDWIDAPAFTTSSGNLVVALLLTEQSVSAVEDQALREVALGGPDSAARMRLMQHFLRLNMTGTSCADGATAVGALLTADGVTLDPASLQLMSQATLQAGFVPGPPNTDACQPVAAGGYLGADNQLVRVTVINYVTSTKQGTLLWGWNNASLLYRASATDASTLTLTSVPVDEEHAPQLGQAVEILRTQADLTDGNLIAEPQGFVTTLAQAYSFDTGDIVLNDALPAAYQSDKNPLFVRLWQATVPFSAGQPTALDSVSGITVTITLPALPSQIALRPFWRFAVRPSMPVQIYPKRYQDKPQPPDGPRQWLADLAVVQAQASGCSLLADCRVPFKPLTEQGGQCCCLVLGPNDVSARGGLQAILDSLAGTKSMVALLPGTYELAAPILLRSQHAGLTLEGCGTGVNLTPVAANLSEFLFGMVLLDQAPQITLRRLTFQMRNVPLGQASGNIQPAWSLGIVASGAVGLAVEQCAFVAHPTSAYLFSAGLVIIGTAAGLTVRDNDFATLQFTPGAMIFGVLVTVLSANVTTSLANAEISDNGFENLAAGVVAFCELGFVSCRDNQVTNCGIGLLFAASNLGATTEVAQQAQNNAAGNAALSQAVNVGLQASLLSNMLSTAGNLTTKFQAPQQMAVSNVAQHALVEDIVTRGQAAYQALATPAQGAATTSGAAAAAPVHQTVTINQALQSIRDVSVAAEIVGFTQTPVLHLSGNDITLASTAGTPGIGIGIVFSPRDESGTVLLTANRVTTPDVGTSAAAVLFPAVATVTGNAFIQAKKEAQTAAPALVFLAERLAVFEVAANVIFANAIILPARSNPGATTAWNFLNTVT